MVYDITQRKSFENLSTWLNDVKQYADPNVSLILVGNKVDLEDQRQVTESEANEWAQRNNINVCLQTSAMNSLNVDIAFDRVCFFYLIFLFNILHFYINILFIFLIFLILNLFNIYLNNRW